MIGTERPRRALCDATEPPPPSSAPQSRYLASHRGRQRLASPEETPSSRVSSSDETPASREGSRWFDENPARLARGNSNRVPRGVRIAFPASVPWCGRMAMASDETVGAGQNPTRVTVRGELPRTFSVFLFFLSSGGFVASSLATRLPVARTDRARRNSRPRWAACPPGAPGRPHRSLDRLCTVGGETFDGDPCQRFGGAVAPPARPTIPG